jgi:hypothetical protein
MTLSGIELSANGSIRPLAHSHRISAPPKGVEIWCPQYGEIHLISGLVVAALGQGQSISSGSEWADRLCISYKGIKMSSPVIQPKSIRYIKLGDGGRWAKDALSEGVLSFGYHSIPHEMCERKVWNEVRHLLSKRKSEGAQTAGVTEVTTFYEMGDDCLWITFAEGHLYWAFAHSKVEPSGDGTTDKPSRKRMTLDG